MPEVKFYEQGRKAGDFMGVQDRIEGRSEWAIVLDHTGYGNVLEPQTPHYEVWVNGQLMSTVESGLEAQQEMHQYLEGRRRIPG